MRKLLTTSITLLIPSLALAVMERTTVSIPELWEQSHIIAIGEVLSVDSTLVSLLVNDNLKLDSSPSDTLHLRIPSRVNWLSCENGVYQDLAADKNPFVMGEDYLIFADATNRIRCMGYSGNGFFLLRTFSLHSICDVEELVIRPAIGVLTHDDLQRLQSGSPPDTSYSFNAALEFPLFDENISFEICPNNHDMNVSSNMYRPRSYIVFSDLESLHGLECYVNMTLGSRSSSYGRNANDVFVSSCLASSDYRIRLMGNIESYEDGVFNLRLYPKRPFLTCLEELDDYLRTQCIADVNMNIEMHHDIYSDTTQNNDHARLVISVDDIDAYVNGTISTLLNPFPGGGYMPEGLNNEYRYIAFFTEGTSVSALGDIIVLQFDSILENFRGDLLYNIFLACKENKCIEGAISIVDDYPSLAEYTGWFTISLDHGSAPRNIHETTKSSRAAL